MTQTVLLQEMRCNGGMRTVAAPTRTTVSCMKCVSGSSFQRCLLRCKSPIQPMRQRFQIGSFHRRASPDAQARRRVAISADIIGNAFLVERSDDALGESGLLIG